MNKKEFCNILKKLYAVELDIKSKAIEERRGRGETDLMILAGKIAILDLMFASKKDLEQVKKDLIK